MTDETSTQKKQKMSFFAELKEAGFGKRQMIVFYLILLASLCVYLTARLLPSFGEFWSRYPGTWLRWLMAKITCWFDFSLFEIIIVCLPVLLIYVLLRIIFIDGKQKSLKDSYRTVKVLICLACVLLSLFMTSFGTCYFRYPLEQNLGLADTEVSAQQLYDTSVYVATELKNLCDGTCFISSGASVMPYSYDELVQKLNDAYAHYCDGVDYIDGYAVNPKPIALSEPFTYTHISGVYSFVTGESNINVNYPDFVMPYTMAHEMAHQHGIAPEDEANFVAYLVCIQSDDDYIKYSAYTSMLNYLRSALYKADKDLYNDFIANYYTQQMRGEQSSYSQMFAKYQNSTASAVTDKINNAYLSSQGQSSGTASYGLVVDLAVAYYESQITDNCN